MNLAALLAAVLAVESNGSDSAIGDHGRARGAYQIHRVVVRDVNRIAGTHYRWEDMHDRKVAHFVAYTYITHYATEKRIGRKPTEEMAARIWNGGPSGWRKPATIRYWLKVKQKMRRDP